MVEEAMLLFLFFFFQAEDGIRDDLVTGVQTCALPIWTPAAEARPPTAPHTPSALWRSPPSLNVVVRIESADGSVMAAPRRSEERRVGKECRDRGDAEHKKKN